MEKRIGVKEMIFVSLVLLTTILIIISLYQSITMGIK